jgi:hypothetical protein
MSMPDSAHRVRVEGVDFSAAFPALRLFEAFRMALQPTKLLLALLLLLLVYFGGITLDFIWGPQQAVVLNLMGSSLSSDYHVFDRLLAAELAWFTQLIDAAARLDLGLGAVTRGNPEGMLGAIYGMLVLTPGRLWSQHPWFFVVFVSYCLVVKMLLGGAIARLAATQACFNRNVGLFEAVRFTWPRAAWYIVSPLIPLLVAGLIWLVLAVSGGVLFNVPVLDVLGGLLFWLMLFGGFLASCLIIFAVLGSGLLPSALAVEGTDAFDVISRVFTFLIYRPARYAILSLVALVYGAITYLLVGLVLFLTLWFTRAAAGVWAEELAMILPAPRLGEPSAAATLGEPVPDTLRVTAWLVRAWTALLFGLSIAYAISYFFTAQTWIYLLLRRDVDGTDFSDAHPEPAAAKPLRGEPEKVEAAEPIDEREAADEPGAPDDG